jgi:hypothetical protein
MAAAFDREAVRRLPLAEATLRLVDFALDDEFLGTVFDRHRGRSYQNVISFPSFVHLISGALLARNDSAHQTFRLAQASDSHDAKLDATVQAVYGKLRRVPLELSIGLFAETAARLRAVQPPVVANPLPPSLADFWTLGFDGKKLKYVAKKLKSLRGLKGNVFGGKLLVVQDLATQQAVAVSAVMDGEAADNPLVPAMVEQVRALADASVRPRLWIGDRAFCDFKLLGLLAEGSDHFVVRFNTSCGFHLDPDAEIREGIDDEGRPFKEEWGWLGKPKNPHRIRVRRITVTRVGKTDPLILVTSLLDADVHPGAELLTLYRSRWGLEVMFQHVVQTFDLRHLIGTTAQATVFQAVLCLLLYNTTLTIRDTIAESAKRPPKSISVKLLFKDIVRSLTGLAVVLGAAKTLEVLRGPQAERTSSAEQLREHLRNLLSKVWTERWAKAKTIRNRPRPSARAYICGGHSSVDKIQQGLHREIPLKASADTKGEKSPPPFETNKDV